jgi:AcrR family transcriptional regulator
VSPPGRSSSRRATPSEQRGSGPPAAGERLADPQPEALEQVGHRLRPHLEAVALVELRERLGIRGDRAAQVGKRAGVRRSTVYRHFPDEDTLFAACSSHWRAGHPPPDPRSWSSIEDPAARTRTALGELYAFYARTEAMYVSLLRDERLVPAVQRRLLDFYGYLGSIRDDLAAGRGLRGRRAQYVRAAIGHALAFPTWRSLAHEQGLGNDDAVELMCRLVEDAASRGRA